MFTVVSQRFAMVPPNLYDYLGGPRNHILSLFIFWAISLHLRTYIQMQWAWKGRIAWNCDEEWIGSTLTRSWAWRRSSTILFLKIILHLILFITRLRDRHRDGLGWREVPFEKEPEAKVIGVGCKFPENAGPVLVRWNTKLNKETRCAFRKSKRYPESIMMWRFFYSELNKRHFHHF